LSELGNPKIDEIKRYVQKILFKIKDFYMKIHWQRFKFIKLLSIALLILAIVFYFDRPIIAQSSLILDADINSLRSRVNRLESEIRRFQSNTDRRIPLPSNNQNDRVTPNFGNPPIVNGRAIGRSDPFYERLATLLIELKEDVRNLDRRLTAIEKQN
jgi:hypothetical protein